jgi:hypothetical protein
MKKSEICSTFWAIEDKRYNVKVKFTLEQAVKAQKVSRGIARWEWVVNATPRPLYPRERQPVPIIQDAGWAPWAVWMGTENLAHTAIQSLGTIEDIF